MVKIPRKHCPQVSNPCHPTCKLSTATKATCTTDSSAITNGGENKKVPNNGQLAPKEKTCSDFRSKVSSTTTVTREINSSDRGSISTSNSEEEREERETPIKLKLSARNKHEQGMQRCAAKTRSKRSRFNAKKNNKLRRKAEALLQLAAASAASEAEAASNLQATATRKVSNLVVDRVLRLRRNTLSMPVLTAYFPIPVLWLRASWERVGCSRHYY